MWTAAAASHISVTRVQQRRKRTIRNVQCPVLAGVTIVTIVTAVAVGPLPAYAQLPETVYITRNDQALLLVQALGEPSATGRRFIYVANGVQMDLSNRTALRTAADRDIPVQTRLRGRSLVDAVVDSLRRQRHGERRPAPASELVPRVWVRVFFGVIVDVPPCDSYSSDGVPPPTADW